MKSYFWSLLTSRRVLYIAPLLALLAGLPTLHSGFFLDDYELRISQIETPDANPYDFRRFATPQMQPHPERGVLPWWVPPDAKLVFFRPVAHWLMQIDYRYWPNNPVLMHAHSILWYVLATLVVVLVYRSFMSWSLATGLAALMFVIDGAHGFALAWICNRYIFVAMATAFLALLFFRRESCWWQLVGCVCFAISLGCGEAALAVTGYFFAHEVFLSNRSCLRRIGRLLPYALIAVAWLAYWRFRDFGIRGPGFYVDPVDDPSLFLQALLFRLPAYLVGELASVPMEALFFLENSAWRTAAMLVLFALCALFAVLLWPLLRRSPLARFYALGMFIAILPVVGSQLVTRALCFAGFGGIGLMALLLEAFFLKSIPPTVALPKTRSGNIFAVTMLVLHFVMSSVVYFAGIKTMETMNANLDTRKLGIPNADGRDRHVLLLSSVYWYITASFPLIKDEALSIGTEPSRPPPTISKLRTLTSGYCDFTVQRVDADTLIIHCDTGFDDMGQGKWMPKIGEYTLDDMTVSVRSLSADGKPAHIEYRFLPGALDRYEVFAWAGERYVPSQLPAVGEARVYHHRPQSPQ